jgi:hypothetical protein
MARLLAESLEEIADKGRPPLGAGHKMTRQDRLRVDVFPSSRIDRALFAGFEGYVLMQEGVDLASALRQQGRIYRERDPVSGVSVVLGAGNVSSIPPMDAFTKLFGEGMVCIIKMNPVNEWVGPHLEYGLAPLIDAGYLRIVYGAADVGKQLIDSPLIDDVHITGSDRTHDMIVWGPPGPARERRVRDGEPLLQVPISSELGNVSPVAIVPYHYSDEELHFQARNVASMVINNASFNCNAAKLLITSARWPQRERFLLLLEHCLDAAPTRLAYYPGAFERYDRLVGGRTGLRKFGQRTETHLPWTLIRDVDAEAEDEPLFRTEPFCSILSETCVGSADPVEFLVRVTDFMNERLWGTLNAALIIAPKLERDRSVGRVLDECIVNLRYGTVAINHWPAVGYGATTLPWGGHPSANLKDIQSGLGWVHNTFLLGGIDKSVIRGPIRVRPTPPWFADNRQTTALGSSLVAMETAPRLWKVPGVALKALRA